MEESIQYNLYAMNDFFALILDTAKILFLVQYYQFIKVKKTFTVEKQNAVLVLESFE